MIILEKTYSLTCEEHKTHKIDSFEVEEGTKRVIVDFRYSPERVDDRSLLKEKIVEEASVFPPMKRRLYESHFLGKGMTLRNLLTLTLVGPDGIVGCAHNQGARPTIVISEDEASPGFLKGAPVPGTWNVVVSAFSLYRIADAALRIEGVAE